MSCNVLHLLIFGCFNGDNKSTKDCELIFSKVVYMFVGNSAIHVKFETIKRTMRDTTTWVLPARKNNIARLLSKC